MREDTGRRGTHVPRGRRPRRSRWPSWPGAVLAVTCTGLPLARTGATEPAGTSTQAAVTTLSQQTDTVLGTTGPVREERLSAPDRIVVHDDLGPVATFTFGSRTVTLRGPQRTFIEATTTAMGD